MFHILSKNNKTMKKKISIAVVVSMTLFLTSCSVMGDLLGGMAAGMGAAAYGSYGGYSPVGTYGSSIPASWGNGYAGPMTYSSDPIVNSTIAIAQTESRLASQGVNISSGSSSSRNTRSTSSSSSSSSDNGWYKCCADAPNFGIVTYHVCSNCGARHQTGSGHMCKRK